MKKILICFAVAFVIVSNIFVCSAVSISDISVSNNQSLNWSVMNKCAEISAEGKGYLLCRATKYTLITLGKNNAGTSAFKTVSYGLNAGDYCVFSCSSDSFSLNGSNLNYNAFFSFDSNGNLLDTYSSYSDVNNLSFGDFDFVATNVGVYNSNHDCVFYSTCIPVAQGFYISYHSIIFSVLNGLFLILPALILYISIRKGWIFAKSNVLGA